MIDTTRLPPSAGVSARRELHKVGAFLWRDLLVARSYPTAIASDAALLIGQALVFSYVAHLVNPASLPRFGGTRASYMSFVTIGIALTAFLQVGLGRMVSAIRAEQYMGTLEPLLVTPTRPTTIQIGSVAYDLIYVPLRTLVFLVVAAATFGVKLDAGGFGPAAAILLAFVPFVWGVGAASAAGVLTFRRGAGIFGAAAFAMTFASGAYFPVTVLPGWIETLSKLNPIAIALDASRRALLGGAGWGDVAPAIGALLIASAIALFLGLTAFRLALQRERRRGTMGLY
jgi:ABC-2 type transport system permease protein